MPDPNLIPEHEAAKLLQENGIPYPEFGFAATSHEAAEIAGRIGYPVVLKVSATGVIHKSDIGGVIVNLTSSDSVVEAFNGMRTVLTTRAPGAAFQGTIVCKQVQPGIELIVGGMQDVMFGPALMVGLGGIFTEVLKDVSFRVIPLQKIDSLEMLKELKGFPILEGARGTARADMEVLTGFLLKVSEFFTQNSWIKELDLNPVRITGDQIFVLDARILK